MVEEGMYRSFFWMYLLGGQRAFSRPLWAMARLLWTAVFVFIGTLLLVGLLAHVSPAATTAPAIVEVPAVVAPVAAPVVHRKVRTKVTTDTRCPGCSDDVVKVLR